MKIDLDAKAKHQLETVMKKFLTLESIFKESITEIRDLKTEYELNIKEIKKLKSDYQEEISDLIYSFKNKHL